jgi:hypothetical protein
VAVLRSLKLISWSLGCLLILSEVAVAQLDMPLHSSDPRLEPATVRELVARYCRLDYAGARLNQADWPKLQPVVSWTSNPDYSLFMITARFDVDTDAVPEHGKYQVMVHYRLLGKFDLSEGYSVDSANHVEDVRYTVAQVNGEWRVTDAEPSYPHPSRAATLQWLNGKLANAKDEASQTIYQNAITRLQTQNASPLAK